MIQHTLEPSQRTAARVAGISLLVLIASGLFGMAIGSSNLIVDGNAAATAHNILTHPRLFRIGIASEMVMFNCDVVLALALYVLLKPVSEGLALLGTFWRFANAVVLGVSAMGSLVVLDLLGGGAYLTAFKTDQVQALTTLALDVHDTGSLVGIIFWGLGAAVHSYLLIKSGYIPRYCPACISLPLQRSLPSASHPSSSLMLRRLSLPGTLRWI